MALNTVTLYNEKGNIQASVRNAIKASVLPVLSDALATVGRDVITGNDGALYLPVALDEQGNTIYARAEVTISVKDPLATVEKAKKTATPKDPVVLPDLF